MYITRAHGWRLLGETGADGAGLVCGDILVGDPSKYCVLKWKMEYECGRIIITQNICVNPIVTFQTVLVTVEFYDLLLQLADDDSIYHYNPCLDLYCWFGVTGDNGTGTVVKELLPTWYWFRSDYYGLSDSVRVDVGLTPLIQFYQANLKTSPYDGNKITEITAYPNPFSGNTTVAFTLEEADKVTIDVYDVNGKRVDNIYEGYLPDGKHQFNWDAYQLHKGMYIMRLNTSTTVSHKNVIRL